MIRSRLLRWEPESSQTNQPTSNPLAQGKSHTNIAMSRSKTGQPTAPTLQHQPSSLRSRWARPPELDGGPGHVCRRLEYRQPKTRFNTCIQCHLLPPATAKEGAAFVPPPRHPLLSTMPLPQRQAKAWAKHGAEAKLAYDKYCSQLQAQAAVGRAIHRVWVFH